MGGDFDLTPRVLGEAYAYLKDGGGITAYEVDEAFWSETIGTLPPGRLVSLFSFESDWGSWEVHPKGEELVMLLSGEMTLILERRGSEERIALEPGQFIIVPKGAWHTADVHAPAKALFITEGEGTQNRPR